MGKIETRYHPDSAVNDVILSIPKDIASKRKGYWNEDKWEEPIRRVDVIGWLFREEVIRVLRDRGGYTGINGVEELGNKVVAMFPSGTRIYTLHLDELFERFVG